MTRRLASEWMKLTVESWSGPKLVWLMREDGRVSDGCETRYPMEACIGGWTHWQPAQFPRVYAEDEPK